jgi:NADH-quinone oxidoreductase subunit I
MSYIGDIVGGVKSLLTGMSITGKYFFVNFFTRKEVITQEYPDNLETLKMYDRFRGEVIMFHDENNEHLCTGCSACERACPNGTIEIIWKKELNPETGRSKRAIDKHIYHLGMCTMCGLCIEACPTNAIGWGQDFHHTTYDRADLTKILNKPGSKLKSGTKE